MIVESTKVMVNSQNTPNQSWAAASAQTRGELGWILL